MIETLPQPLFDVKPEHTEDEHFYVVDGVKRPGTTGFLDIVGGDKTMMLMGWSKKMVRLTYEAELRPLMNDGKGVLHFDEAWLKDVAKKAWKSTDKKKKEAGEYGTRAHDYLDLIVKALAAKQFQVAEDLRRAAPSEIEDTVLAFFRAVDFYGLTFIAGDTLVGSRVHGYGGALDWLAVDKAGNLVLGDFKTSNGIRDTYAFQLGGYNQGLIERFSINAAYGLIMRLGKEAPDFELGHVANLDAAFDGFLLCKKLTEAMAHPLWVKVKEGVAA